jgi:hypothetical protein
MALHFQSYSSLFLSIFLLYISMGNWWVDCSGRVVASNPTRGMNVLVHLFYECCHHIRYSTVWSECEPTFRRNGAMSQKMETFIITAVRTSTPTRFFYVCAVWCVSKGLSTDLSPPRVPPTVYSITEVKKPQRSTKLLRAMNKWWWRTNYYSKCSVSIKFTEWNRKDSHCQRIRSFQHNV